MVYFIYNRGGIVNRKGQALVEFVLILPVFIYLVFASLDVGRVILCKNHLEGMMNDVSMMVKEEKNIDEIKEFIKDDSYKIDISITYDKYAHVKLNTKLDLVTPGIKRVISENVVVERSVIYE